MVFLVFLTPIESCKFTLLKRLYISRTVETWNFDDFGIEYITMILLHLFFLSINGAHYLRGLLALKLIKNVSYIN